MNKRTASVIAKENCEFAVLDKSDYIDIFGDLEVIKKFIYLFINK
jgi:hypothetical protein